MPTRQHSQTSAPGTLAKLLLETAAAFPARPALKVDNQTYSYKSLFDEAQRQAIKLADVFAAAPEQPPIVAIWASRHVSSYISILATILAGGCYVPLNPKTSMERNQDILEQARASVLLHEAEVSAAMAELTHGLDHVHTALIGAPTGIEGSAFTAPHIAPHENAYILFTSGSTGKPKGVPISHGNLLSYLDAAKAIVEPDQNDRVSQTFDLTFDLSVHDVFMALTSGAQLCVPSVADLQKPSVYITRDEITCWFCVPSLGYTPLYQGALTPNAFPSLRMSLFCGEALPKVIADGWSVAAPNSAIENWYGPTEATIACLRFNLSETDGTEAAAASPEWRALAQAGGETVPIGAPFGDTRAAVLDAHFLKVADGQIGQLFVTGPQIAAGYLDAPEQTADKFRSLPGQDGIYYDTGDLVREIDGVLHFCGRSDDQIKLRGFRIELGDVENALRKANGNSQVVVLPWPPKPATATHLVAAIETPGAQAPDFAALRDLMSASLPEYMIPSSIVTLPRFAKNTSGKLDRKIIGADLEKALLAKQALVKEGAANLDISDLETRVLDMILSLKPSLDPTQILSASSLVWAGLDSANLVSLSLLIEQELDIELDMDSVAAIGVMNFAQLIAFFETGRLEIDVFEGLSPAKVRRANRAIEFVQALPNLLKSAEKPVLLVLGSSGTLRGFRADVAEAEAQEFGQSLQIFNAGLPAISVEGFTRICEHIASVCQAEKVTLAGVIYEMDPMIVSTQPPKGDIQLHEAVFTEGARLSSQGAMASEFHWDADARGDVEFDMDKIQKHHRARWERARDFVINDVYQGRVPFETSRVEDWLKGVEHLQKVTDNFAVFVHPIQPNDHADDAPQGLLYKDLIKQLAEMKSLQLIASDSFDIPHEYFLNINHMEPVEGSTVFTRQLMRQFFAPLA